MDTDKTTFSAGNPSLSSGLLAATMAGAEWFCEPRRRWGYVQHKNGPSKAKKRARKAQRMARRITRRRG
jgi:hypothetical protein